MNPPTKRRPYNETKTGMQFGTYVVENFRWGKWPHFMIWHGDKNLEAEVNVNPDATKIRVMIHQTLREQEFDSGHWMEPDAVRALAYALEEARKAVDGARGEGGA